MILRGGENISPYEIEEVLLAHPAVADAVCFGVDDEKYGERVGAAVALERRGRRDGLIAAGAASAWRRSRCPRSSTSSRRSRGRRPERCSA